MHMASPPPPKIKKKKKKKVTNLCSLVFKKTVDISTTIDKICMTKDLWKWEGDGKKWRVKQPSVLTARTLQHYSVNTDSELPVQTSISLFGVARETGN